MEGVFTSTLEDHSDGPKIVGKIVGRNTMIVISGTHRWAPLLALWRVKPSQIGANSMIRAISDNTPGVNGSNR